MRSRTSSFANDPELEYLTSLLRAFATDAPRAERTRPVDWARLLGLLRLHRLASALGPLIADGDAPPAFRETLGSDIRQGQRRSTLIALESVRALAAIEERRIRVLLLKGPALGETVYPRADQRYSRDIDILVDARNVDDTCRVLGELGYAPAATARHTSFYRRHHFHLIVRHRLGLLIEVHWNLSRPRDYFQFDIEGLFARSRVLERSHGRFRVPSDMDQILHAASQALRGGFRELHRVLDAALLLRQGAGDDPSLPAIAARQGLATACWLLLGLQERLVGVPVRPDLESALRPRPMVRRCLDSLDLEERAIAGDSLGRLPLKRLLLVLAAPSIGTGSRELRGFLAPGDAELLDEGPDPDRLPGLVSRALLGARHGVVAARLLAYQAWRLASHRERAAS
jgi:hypothetical protein